ncbi:MAG TPA: ATP-dependent DNA helicase, partial [Steroidobacteraceae bacterium]|nr:ATP-dependent DNA helicase [Steroidobacteraceae bacterium]
MARAVGEALERRESLVVEAGTGTGKTFAYLVPALLSGRHTIISTGTRTLQDQLFNRDLPALSAALGRPVSVALLKGRANYLCRHRLVLARASPELPLGDCGRESGSASRMLARIERWSLSTRTGDVSELSGIPEAHPLWGAVTSTRENCLGLACAEYARCHVVAARRAALAADVVVVNHHLLLADFALKQEGFGDLLPGTEAVILDEAHQIPDVAAQFFGASFSGRQLQAFVRDAQAELRSQRLVATELEASLARLDQLHAALKRALPTSAGKVDWQSLSAEGHDVLAEIEQVLVSAQRSLAALGESGGVQHSARRAATLAAECAHLRGLEVESGVRWIESSARNWSVEFTPFEVADRIREWREAAPSAWIFTSATLAVGKDFGHFLGRIGAPDAETLCIQSPFDFKRQALLYLPERISDPGDPAHTRDTIEAALPLIEAAGGRAFILFTSHRALSEGGAYLKGRVAGTAPYPILTQGEAPRELLLRQFRELGNAVLLGTGSFWEGVDVKGEALSIVVIDKLPFASPDDPLLKARL